MAAAERHAADLTIRVAPGRRGNGRVMETTVPDVADNPAASRFDVSVDGEPAGFAEYRTEGTALALVHTEVDPTYEGRGVGSALVRGMLDAARERGVDVLPYCPFVRDWIARHAGYADLVPADRREGFRL